MSDANKMSHAFAHAKTGFDLVNVKFFLGDNRNITQDELNKAIEDTMTQAKLNSPVDVSKIDRHLQSNNISAII